MPRNFNDGSYRCVNIKGYAGLNYGFMSRTDAANYPILGQAIINSSTTGLVIGCNSPKPGRATKKRATGGRESGFYSNGAVDKTADLKAAGWKLTTGRRRYPGNSKVSKALYVEIGGVNYAWNCTLPTDGLPAAYLEAAGAAEIPADKLVVWGCDYPKPAVIATEIAPGKVFSSFCSPAKIDTLPDGWEVRLSAKFGADAQSKYNS